MVSDSTQLLINLVFPAVRLILAPFVTPLIKSPTTGPHLTAIPENLSLRRRRRRRRRTRSDRPVEQEFQNLESSDGGECMYWLTVIACRKCRGVFGSVCGFVRLNKATLSWN